jgi:hypothetical protein
MGVKFNLYQTNGTSLVHTFETIFSANYPHTEKTLIEHTNVRGKGSIIVDGGDSSWDLTLKGVIFAADYDAIMTKVAAIESAVVLNTPYYLKITDKAGTVNKYEFKCKRITPIEYTEDNIRTNYLEYQVTLRIFSW